MVAAPGDHLGEAIAAARQSVPGAWPVAADRIADDAIPLGESVGRGGVVRLGEVPAGLPTFRWPAGVLPRLDAPVTAARVGWVARRHDALSVIEAQPDADHVVDLYLGLIERMPSADNLEIRILDHFEGGGATDVWLTSRIDGKKVIRFLDDHEDELIGNGHVELSVYLRAQRATLRLTEHKTVVWLSDEREHDAAVGRWLGELGVPTVETLITVADGPHFHYRHGKSRSRKALGDHLYRQRLRRVDKLKRPSA